MDLALSMKYYIMAARVFKNLPAEGDGRAKVDAAH
jgi:hypothetical protein